MPRTSHCQIDSSYFNLPTAVCLPQALRQHKMHCYISWDARAQDGAAEQLARAQVGAAEQLARAQGGAAEQLARAAG